MDVTFPPAPPPNVPAPPPSFPWETAPGAGAWLASARLVLTSPVAAFSAVPPTGGIGRPFLFWLPGVLLGMIGTTVSRVARWALTGRLDDLGLGMMALAVVVAFPIGLAMTIALTFGYAGVVHLLLGLTGGARRGYEATYRVLVYTYGSAAPIGLVPFIGSIIAVVWAIVVAIPGLARMHETTPGKAAFAVLAPLAACCGLIVLLVVAVLGAALSVR